MFAVVVKLLKVQYLFTSRHVVVIPGGLQTAVEVLARNIHNHSLTFAEESHTQSWLDLHVLYAAFESEEHWWFALTTAVSNSCASYPTCLEKSRKVHSRTHRRNPNYHHHHHHHRCLENCKAHHGMDCTVWLLYNQSHQLRQTMTTTTTITSCFFLAAYSRFHMLCVIYFVF